jgi:hypothetical protein
MQLGTTARVEHDGNVYLFRLVPGQRKITSRYILERVMTKLLSSKIIDRIVAPVLFCRYWYKEDE